jgi:hypothetical protein
VNDEKDAVRESIVARLPHYKLDRFGYTCTAEGNSRPSGTNCNENSFISAVPMPVLHDPTFAQGTNLAAYHAGPWTKPVRTIP